MFELYTDFLLIECMMKGTPDMRFLTAVSIVFVWLLLAVLIYTAAVLTKHSGAFRSQMLSLLGPLGAMASFCLIPIAFLMISPLDCSLHHPGGLESMTSYPSVVCWKTESHRVMVVASLASLLAPLAFVANCCWYGVFQPKRNAATRVSPKPICSCSCGLVLSSIRIPCSALYETLPLQCSQ